MTLGRHPAKATLLIAIGTAVTATAQEFPEPYFPAPETLPNDQLIQWLEDWDDAVASASFAARSRLLAHIGRRVPDGMQCRGAWVVRYDNPDIQRRLADQYLYECGKYGTERDAGGVSETNPWYGGEGGAEYMIALMSLAESTFSPRIFEVELKGALPVQGELRELYLARVDPQAALDALFNATFAARRGRPAGLDTFYTVDDGTPLFDVTSAFAFLFFVRELAPGALMEQRDRVREFVSTHAKHYAEPRLYAFRSTPVYYRYDDYSVRRAAMHVLDLVAKPADIALVKSLLEDIPSEPKTRDRAKAAEIALREELDAEAGAIIARIEKELGTG